MGQTPTKRVGREVCMDQHERHSKIERAVEYGRNIAGNLKRIGYGEREKALERSFRERKESRCTCKNRLIKRQEKKRNLIRRLFLPLPPSGIEILNCAILKIDVAVRTQRADYGLRITIKYTYLLSKMPHDEKPSRYFIVLVQFARIKGRT